MSANRAFPETFGMVFIFAYRARDIWARTAQGAEGPVFKHALTVVAFAQKTSPKTLAWLVCPRLFTIRQEIWLSRQRITVAGCDQGTLKPMTGVPRYRWQLRPSELQCTNLTQLPCSGLLCKRFAWPPLVNRVFAGLWLVEVAWHSLEGRVLNLTCNRL
jgi:hypothetical protein